LWLFANPFAAHVHYDQNKAVIRAMIPKQRAAREANPAK